MYGFSDQPNIMPLTRFRADLQGSSRYSGRIVETRIEHPFDFAESPRTERVAGRTLSENAPEFVKRVNAVMMAGKYPTPFDTILEDAGIAVVFSGVPAVVTVCMR